jgi:hypothetical protein
MSFQSKIIFFSAFPVILALAFSYLLAANNFWLAEQNNLYPFLIFIIGILFLAFFALQVFLIEPLSFGLVLIFLEAAALISFFLPQINYWTGAAFLIFYLFLSQSFYFGRQKIANILNLKISVNSRPIIKRALIGVVLGSVLLQTSVLDLKNYSVSSFWLTNLKWSSETAGKFFIDNFSLDNSLGRILGQLSRRSLSAEFTNYSPEVQEQLVQNSVNVLLNNIQRWTIIRPNPEERAIDTLRRIINLQIKRIPEQLYLPIKIGLIVILFLVINSLSFIIIWLVGFLSWLIFKLLLAAKFAKITHQSKEAEHISL